ncbi:MAG: hypothetical protein IKR76_05275 [Ruminococcus sp.]|nr:hypothetical protein [Ruminococcus sp.]
MHYNELTPYGGVLMALSFLLSLCSGIMLIPLFRFYKTGIYKPHIGDRLRGDDSSPRFGGALMMLGLGAGGIGSVAVLGARGSFDSSPQKQLTAALLYVFLAFAAGFLQDYIKQKLNRPAGLKGSLRFLYLWGLSVCFLISLRLISGLTGEVLLPFRWGFVSFGMFYYPVIGLVMTACIYAFRIHDTYGGEEEYCCEGLMGTTMLLTALFFAVMTRGGCSLLGYITAGSAAGLMIWSFYPAKIYFGESGQLLCGAAFCAMCIISGRELLLIFLPLSAIIDMLSSFIRLLHYKRTKSVLLLGGSLHAHLKAKGRGDVSIIIRSLPLTVLGIAAGVLFIIYSNDIMNI